MATAPRVNEAIRAKQCRVIATDGAQVGIFSLSEALSMAKTQNLDLVEMTAGAEPAVVRILDYSKYRFEQKQKTKGNRKTQSKTDVKEIKFRPKIEIGDYETKKRHIVKFIEAGHKVKVTIMFRGREMSHPELGLAVIERLAADLESLVLIENQPKMEGRNMHMLIVPNRKKAVK